MNVTELTNKMMEKYTANFIVHMYNNLVDKLVTLDRINDTKVNSTWDDNVNGNIFSYAFVSSESGLEVYATLDITDAVDFKLFENYIAEESFYAGFDLEEDWEEIQELLDNLE